MNRNDRERYERRLREKHPERLWWERWRDHRWLIVAIVLAVVVMLWVGYAVA